MKKLIIVPVLALLCSLAHAQDVVSVNPRQLTAATIQQQQEVYIGIKNVFYFKPSSLPVRSVRMSGNGTCRLYKSYIEITAVSPGECMLTLQMRQGGTRQVKLLVKTVPDPVVGGKRD